MSTRLPKSAKNTETPGDIRVEIPATGETLGWVERDSPTDIREAAERAKEAQTLWRETEISDRARILLRFHDLILDRQDEALDLIQRETGKARRHAFEEVLDTAIVARYYANTAKRLLVERRRRGAFPVLTRASEHRRPKGLCGFITPWNYPLDLAATDAVPALMAGNAALVKVDEKTPFTALWAGDLLREAGLPEDLFQIVVGSGEELGPTLIEVSDHVTFTGSSKTGRIVARQSAERLTDFSLELGGKNAMLVLEDADLDRAVAGAQRAVFSGAGQLCVSAERLFVHESVYGEFTERFIERIRSMELNARLDYSADMGSLASGDQLERVVAHVEDAISKGAKVLVGGRCRPDIGPYFFEPTLIENVTREMKLWGEETFGPVAALYRFETEEEATRLANDSDYGLNFSVWTRDAERGERLAARLEAGTVNINDAYVASWASTDAPMGGFKDSGVGRRHGAEGLLKYTEAQTVAVQRLDVPQNDARLYAKATTAALRLLRRLPGVR